MANSVRIPLLALGDGRAPLGVASLPLPGDASCEARVPGVTSQCVPIAFWPRSEETPGGPRKPRRSLLFFENAGQPVAELLPARMSTELGGTDWLVEPLAIEDVARHSDERHWHYYRRPCTLKLARGRSELRLSLCIRNDLGLHRWQYVQIQKLWVGPLVDAYRIGGHIFTGDESPLTIERLREIGDIIKCDDNTVAVSVYLLVFANGTVQATAHWVNGRIYGAVGDQRGVPVVELHGGPRLNLEPAAHLRSDGQSGALGPGEDGSVMWQPVEDTTITIRHLPGSDGVEDVTIPASTEGLVQGAARSVTWLMGVGEDPPAVCRFVAPPEWYARCRDFAPFPIELRDGEFERLGRLCGQALLRNSVRGKFTSGGIWRYLDQYGKGVTELSMDANETRSLFRRAWRDSDAHLYDLATRNAYFMADLAVDHSRDVIHYHGDNQAWRTYSLIYQRFSGLVLGYIETGDYYLLETAEAVARNYMSLHLQNWPRAGIGRDADPLNGFLLLWDYTGKEEYFQFAKEFAHHVILTIGDDGSWLSGAGVGPMMGCNASLGSPWNGGHFLSGFTEYAMRDTDVPAEWLQAAGRALSRLYDSLEREHGGFHPAASGFIGRLHWYLACRLQDADLMDRTHALMRNVLEWERDPGDGLPMFTGPRAHHMNNYADNLIFYEATKDNGVSP